MKTLDKFIVEIEKELQDTITTSSGMELYIDTRFNEFERRTTEGKILAAPLKYNTGAKAGDTLYFHHHVVIHGGSPLVKEDNQYVVSYDHYHAAANQAIAFKNKDGISPIKGWCLLEPVDEDDPGHSGLVEVVSLQEKPVTQGVVSFNTPELEELGVSDGDVVGFKKDRDYRIEIDGKEYYRVAVTELLYKL